MQGEDALKEFVICDSMLRMHRQVRAELLRVQLPLILDTGRTRLGGDITGC